MLKTTRLVLAVVAVLAMAGTLHAEQGMKQSGFLGDYSALKPGPKGGADFVYMKEGVDFAKYNKVMLDEVVFFLKDDAQYKGISPQEMKELADTFHNAVSDALGDAYPLVAEPAPDVIRLRVAITDLVPSKPGVSAVTTVMPIGLDVSVAKKAVTGSYTGAGETGMEIEILDSMSNERVAAAVDQRAAGKLETFSKWGAAEEAFKFWAQRLRTRLDEIHGASK
ncbi:MAG: DUF3313 domain-containing protein [Candidatus Lindowbacteria bacterium]|nr:DUF3313 domain-containing protein [Candidatus Lindowbacteria bacterium]